MQVLVQGVVIEIFFMDFYLETSLVIIYDNIILKKQMCAG